jgi:peroxiredoxin
MKNLLQIPALVLLALLSPSVGRSMPAVGDEAPRFTLRELADDSKSVISQSLFGGKTTLLSFFATWCKPCRAEIPELRFFADRYGERGFQVVLVSLDQVGVGEVKSFLEEVGAGGLQVLWDEEGDVMALYEIMNLPSNVLVGPTGTVRMAWQGHLPGMLKKLEAHLQTLAKQPAAKSDSE